MHQVWAGVVQVKDRCEAENPFGGRCQREKDHVGKHDLSELAAWGRMEKDRWADDGGANTDDH